jgi:hypothetical protein
MLLRPLARVVARVDVGDRPLADIVESQHPMTSASQLNLLQSYFAAEAKNAFLNQLPDREF